MQTWLTKVSFGSMIVCSIIIPNLHLSAWNLRQMPIPQYLEPRN